MRVFIFQVLWRASLNKIINIHSFLPAFIGVLIIRPMSCDGESYATAHLRKIDNLDEFTIAAGRIHVDYTTPQKRRCAEAITKQLPRAVLQVPAQRSCYGNRRLSLTSLAIPDEINPLAMKVYAKSPFQRRNRRFKASLIARI